MDRNYEMWKLRKMFNKMTNNQYDLLIGALGIPGVNKLLYSSNIHVSKYAAFISKLVLREPNK
jgi:hypothetical protein